MTNPTPTTPKPSRDEIALIALQGLLSGATGPDNTWRVERAAVKSYQYADAMLAARKLDLNDQAAVRRFQIEFSGEVGF